MVLQQRVQKHGLCGALRRETNWRSLFLAVLIGGCLGAIAWCFASEVTEVSSTGGSARPVHCQPACPPVIINLSMYPSKRTRKMSRCEDGYVFVPLAFLLVLYAAYLMDCWHCETRRRLRGHRASPAQVLERVRRMREAHPVVWWRAVSYHYVRQKRHLTRQRNGDAYVVTQFYHERVNSHSSVGYFAYRRCGVRDISKDLQLRPDGPLSRITFSKGFAFANTEAAAEYERQRERFFAEQQRRDDYLEMCEGLDVCNFREELLVRCGDWLSWLHSGPVFWLCSLLLLSWPLRILRQSRTASANYQVMKLFGVNYETQPSTSGNNNNRRSCGDCEEPGSSHDSVDLEYAIVDNVSMVPSYSEALLMDAALVYPAPLVRRSPNDPYQGRNSTTPTEDPPGYDEALQLPTVSRLRRSLTERGDLYRRSCLPGVGRARLNMETSL